VAQLPKDGRRTFADETTTGIRPELRGPFKATIAARVDTEDLEWWLQFTRDFLRTRRGRQIPFR
jgi:hypothetical protein